MRLLVVADDPAATITTIRLREPLSVLCAQEGWPLAWRAAHACTQRDLAGADVLVLQRGVTERTWRLQQQMRALGGRVVYEIDDLLVEPAPHVLHHDALVQGRPWVERALAAADVVTVTTQRLADALAPLASACRVVPNCAPAAAPRARARDPAAPLTLVVVASDRLDAAFIAPALAAAAQARPGRLRVACVGHARLAFEGVAVDVHALMPRAAYFDFLAALVNPLAVIPIDASPFSACKSAIKVFDDGAIGVPVMCSRLAPYADAVTDGRTGILVDNTVPAWTAALIEAIDRPAHLQALADAARAEVALHHSFARTVDAWRDVLAALPPRLPTTRAPGAWSALVERLGVALRAANRARLARRDAHRR